MTSRPGLGSSVPSARRARRREDCRGGWDGCSVTSRRSVLGFGGWVISSSSRSRPRATTTSPYLRCRGRRRLSYRSKLGARSAVVAIVGRVRVPVTGAFAITSVTGERWVRAGRAQQMAPVERAGALPAERVMASTGWVVADGRFISTAFRLAKPLASGRRYALTTAHALQDSSPAVIQFPSSQALQVRGLRSSTGASMSPCSRSTQKTCLAPGVSLRPEAMTDVGADWRAFELPIRRTRRPCRRGLDHGQGHFNCAWFDRTQCCAGRRL